MSHPAAAAAFVANRERTAWHDKALWFVRQKRDRMVGTVPEWESLRTRASAIKAHTLSNIADYLEAFEKNANARGIQVHWADTAEDHNRIVHEILARHQVKKLVKSKSMLTEECHLNGYLESRGIDVVDTDLGERIVQLREEPPSHIVMPAIHIKKEEVGELFHDKLGTEAGASDPAYLTEAARGHLREKFLEADAGLTGVNFAIAETGGFVVCTNEGNADLGTHLPPVHIACMGFEKIIPRLEDLSVFTRLLGRSATGQPITSYTSHFLGPREGQEMHVVIVDNGRTLQMAKDEFKASLHCIRCGACINTCPVYRRSGGHSYQFTSPGPIGSVIAPWRDPKAYSTLPFASTLCGSCTDVCPVKINLHEQLLSWRKELVDKGELPAGKRMGMKFAAYLFAKRSRFERIGKIGRWCLRNFPRFMIYNPMNAWGRQRDLPPAPKESFRDWYRKNGGAS